MNTSNCSSSVRPLLSSSASATVSLSSANTGKISVGSNCNSNSSNNNSGTVGSTATGKTFNLPESLEMIQRCEYFPTQRHRWNTNEEIASILIAFDKHVDWLSKEVKIRYEFIPLSALSFEVHSFFPPVFRVLFSGFSVSSYIFSIIAVNSVEWRALFLCSQPTLVLSSQLSSQIPRAALKYVCLVKYVCCCFPLPLPLVLPFLCFLSLSLHSVRYVSLTSLSRSISHSLHITSLLIFIISLGLTATYFHS